ncbi:MAG: hypothetical protein WDW36_006125 [Sanguina aurantia]
MVLTIDSFLFSQPDYRSPEQQGSSARLRPMELWIWIAHPGLSAQPVDGGWDLTAAELAAAGVGVPARLLACPGLIKFKRWNLPALLSSLPPTVFPDDLVDALAGPQLEAQLSSTIYRLYAGPRSGDVVASSDYVRFILLFLHGGLYIDADVLLMRDMRPFMAGMEWFYRWESQAWCNTALLHLHKGGANATNLLKAGLQRALHTSTHVGLLFKRSEPLISLRRLWAYAFHPMNVCPDEVIFAPGAPRTLPSQLFDPPWMKGRPEEAGFPWALPSIKQWTQVSGPASRHNVSHFDFNPGGVRQPLPQPGGVQDPFVDDVITLSVYARFLVWDAPIQPGAWAHVFQVAYDDFMMRRTTNLYGEVFEQVQMCSSVA